MFVCDPQLSHNLQLLFTLYGSFKKNITQTDCTHKSGIVLMTVETHVAASYFLPGLRRSLRFIEVDCHAQLHYFFTLFCQCQHH